MTGREERVAGMHTREKCGPFIVTRGVGLRQKSPRSQSRSHRFALTAITGALIRTRNSRIEFNVNVSDIAKGQLLQTPDDDSRFAARCGGHARARSRA